MTKNDALKMALKILVEQEVELDDDCGHPDCQECQYGNQLREAVAAINEVLTAQHQAGFPVTTRKPDQGTTQRIYCKAK